MSDEWCYMLAADGIIQWQPVVDEQQQLAKYYIQQVVLLIEPYDGTEPE